MEHAQQSLHHGGELYEPVDPGNGEAVYVDSSSRGAKRSGCTEGRTFNFLVGVVVCASAVILHLEADLGLLGPGAPQWKGLESDLGLLGANATQERTVEANLQKGLRENHDLEVKAGLHGLGAARSPQLHPGAYALCEYFFVAFFLLEMSLRLCDQCGAYFRDPWIILDTAVVVQGLSDLVLPLALGPRPSHLALAGLSVLRMMRVLRVVRLLRVCSNLKVAAQAFGSAFAAMMWISTIILVLNFVCAILLTSFIGQKANEWGDRAEDIDAWFGSMGRSMQTLFTVMTLSGWDNIAISLADGIPGAVVACFFVLYIMLCFFAVVSLISGVVGDAFMTSHRHDERFKMQAIEENRSIFVNTFTGVLNACDQNSTGYLSRDEYTTALDSYPVLFARLRKLDIDTDMDELLQLFDRLSQDSEVDGTVRIESLVEAMSHLRGTAKTAGIVDLKNLLLVMRRERGEQAADMTQELTARHKETMSISATTAQVSEVRKDVATVHTEVAAVREQVAAVSERLDKTVASLNAAISEKFAKISAREDADKCDAVAKASEKLDALTAQFTAHFASHLAMLDSKASESADLLGASSAEPKSAKVPALDDALRAAQESAKPALPAGAPGPEPDSLQRAELESASFVEPESAKLVETASAQGSEPERTMHSKPDSSSPAGPESPDAAGVERGVSSELNNLMDLSADEAFKKLMGPGAAAAAGKGADA